MNLKYKELPLRTLVFIPSGILYFLSVFTCNPKITGIGTIQFLLILGCNLYIDRKNALSRFVEYNMGKSQESFSERKWFEFVIYGCVSSLIGIGIFFILVLTSMYFII